MDEIEEVTEMLRDARKRAAKEQVTMENWKAAVKEASKTHSDYRAAENWYRECLGKAAEFRRQVAKAKDAMEKARESAIQSKSKVDYLESLLHEEVYG